MRLDNSCLTQEEFILLLIENWNVNVQSSEYIPGSTALCRKIIANDGCYFFKEFQDSYSISQVTHEHSVCKFLGENNLSVSQILATIHSKPYVIYKNRIFQLQRYIEGNVQKNNTLSRFQICSSAAELGKIHTLLQNHSLPVLFDQVWFEKFDETLYQNYYKETLSLIDGADIPHDYKRQSTDDITFRFTLTKNMRKISKAFCGVTCTPSHGDYIPSQIIFNSTGISGIIDWANVHTVPAVWELIRFFCLAAKDVYDIDLLMEYIITYMQYAELTKLDLKNIPYIYAYYMGRNRFLYREYLKTLRYEDYYDSHRKADLCRFYYENAESIANRLQQTPPKHILQILPDVLFPQPREVGIDIPRRPNIRVPQPLLDVFQPPFIVVENTRRAVTDTPSMPSKGTLMTTQWQNISSRFSKPSVFTV